MFSRNKSSVPPEDEAIVETEAKSKNVSPPKGRPTPKRADQEAANKRPLVPANNKGAGKASKEKARQARDAEYQALRSGDERNYPLRDRGPQRKYVRDYIDARWSLAEWFLPAAFGFMILSMLLMRLSPALASYLMLLVYVVLIAGLIDTVLMWRRIRKYLVQKYGRVERGLGMYAGTRAFQIRRLRMPKPLNKKRGDYRL